MTLDQLVIERRFDALNQHHRRALLMDTLAPELLEMLEQNPWHADAVARVIAGYRQSVLGSGGNASWYARQFERVVADGGDLG